VQPAPGIDDLHPASPRLTTIGIIFDEIDGLNFYPD